MTRVSLLLRLLISTVFILKCCTVNGLQCYSFNKNNKSTYKEICEILFEKQTAGFFNKTICIFQLTLIHKNGYDIADLKNIAKGIRKWNPTIETFKQVINIFSTKKWPSDAAEKLLAVHSPYQIENINEILNKESWNFWQPYYDTKGFAESFGLYISMYDFIDDKNIYLNDVNEYRDWYEEEIKNERETSNALDKNLFGCDYEQLKVMSDFFDNSSIKSKEEKYIIFEAVCHEGKIKWKSFILANFLYAYFNEQTVNIKTLNGLKYGYETLKEIYSKKYIQLDWNMYYIISYISSCYKYTDKENCIKLRIQLVLKCIKIFMNRSTFMEIIERNGSIIDVQVLLQIISYMDYFGFSFRDNSNSQSSTQLNLSDKIIIHLLNICRSTKIEESELLISFVLYNAMYREWNTEDLSEFLDKTLNKYNFVAYDYYRFFDVVKCKNVNEALSVLDFFVKLDKSPAVFYNLSLNEITVKNNLGLLLDVNNEEELNKKKDFLNKNPVLYEYPNIFIFIDGCNIKFVSSVVNFFFKISNKNRPNEDDIKIIYLLVCTVEKTKEGDISEILNNAINNEEDIKSLKTKLRSVNKIF